MGIGAAAIMPSTLSIIANVFDPARARQGDRRLGRRGRARRRHRPGRGRLLLEHFWWGSVFLINVPIIVVGLVVVVVLVPESNDPKPGRIDCVGVVLSIVGLVACRVRDHRGRRERLRRARGVGRDRGRRRHPGRVRALRAAQRPSRRWTCACSATRVLGRRPRSVGLIFFAALGSHVLPAPSTCSWCAATRRCRPACWSLPFALGPAHLRPAQRRDGEAVRPEGGLRGRPVLVAVGLAGFATLGPQHADLGCGALFFFIRASAWPT